MKFVLFISALIFTAQVHGQTPPAETDLYVTTRPKPSTEVLPPGTTAPELAGPCAGPGWSKDALPQGAHAVVVLRLLVGTDGLVKDKVIMKTSGVRELDKAVFIAFDQCKFKPGTVEGQVTAQWKTVQYVLRAE